MTTLYMGAVRNETRWLEEELAAVPRLETPWYLAEAPRALFLTGGIGPANAAGALAWALATREVTRIVDVGSAGSYDLEVLPLEAVAIVSDDQFADMGATLEDGQWRTSEELRLHLWTEPVNRFPCALPPRMPRHFAFPVIRAAGATVHHVAGTPEEGVRRRERCGAMLESMEGAAVALVALRMGVPLFQVRGISNLAGGPRGGWRTGPAGLHAQQVAHWLVSSLEGAAA